MYPSASINLEPYAHTCLRFTLAELVAKPITMSNHKYLVKNLASPEINLYKDE